MVNLKVKSCEYKVGSNSCVLNCKSEVLLNCYCCGYWYRRSLIMASKLFSRLRSSSSRDTREPQAPPYSASASPSVEEIPSPPYEERGARPNTLTRTVSDSSYTSAEISSWNDAADDAQTSQNEELPPYEERPLLPNLTILRTMASVMAPRRRPPHSMCPCAQCHSLR